MPQTAPLQSPDHTTCTNCGEPLWSDSAFCPQCGQKVYQGPPGFLQLFAEFFETVFSLDNRLFRTLKALAVPGRLTNRFLAGQQKPYFHPLRLFFVSGVLMVATFSLTITQALGDELDKSTEQRRARAYQNQHAAALRLAVDSIRQLYPDTAVAAATDSLLSRLAVKATDNFYLGYLRYDGGLTFTPTELDFSLSDYTLLTPEEIVRKHEIKGIVNQYQVQQIIRLTRIGLPGISALMGQFIWGLLLLVPLAAGLLKLMYLRRERKYVEHFIFTLHAHSFMFLILFLGALELLITGSSWILSLASILLIGYFLLALKRVYGQSWGKTVIKAFLLGMGYLFLLPIALSIGILVAVLVF